MNNLKLGQLAEEIASNFLRKKGYIILERNFKNKIGEIDIIAIRPTNILQYFFRKRIFPSSRIIFVEVKASKTKSFFSPEERINYFKKQKLINLAYSYIKDKKIKNSFQIDAIRIYFENKKEVKIKHIENAVEED